MDSLAREIVYRLIEADEPVVPGVVPGGEPERPRQPERPPREAPEAEWEAYFEAIEAYAEAMRKYHVWMFGSQLDDEGAPKPDHSVEPPAGYDPATSSLPRTRSTN